MVAGAGPGSGPSCLLVALMGLLVACAPPGPAAPATLPPAPPGRAEPARPEPAARLEVVTLGIPRRTFGYLALFVGLHKGYFAETGLDLQVRELQCNLIIAAQQRGDMQINGCATSALRAAAENQLSIKAIFFSYNKATFVFMGHPSVATLADLRGKNVGISGYGAETHEIARRLLAQHGLQSERDYTFLAVGAGAQMFAALQSGAIQAGLLNTDEAAKLVGAGYPVLASSDAVGELLPIPFSGFTVLEDTLRQARDVLVRWMRAHVRALVLIRDQPDEAARIAAAELGLDPEEARSAVYLTVPAIARDRPGYASEEGMRVLLEYALGDAAQGKTPAQFFDFSLLDEAYRQGL